MDVAVAPVGPLDSFWGMMLVLRMKAALTAAAALLNDHVSYEEMTSKMEDVSVPSGATISNLPAGAAGGSTKTKLQTEQTPDQYQVI